MFQLTKIGLSACVALLMGYAVVSAGPITDRIADGETIRVGYSNIPPWGFPDENGDPKGFVNEIAIGILNSMGYDNVEGTVTDWSGLIPGLQANRYDMITGGMYILYSRCQNIAFSEPIAQAGDAFLVPAGNPKGIQTYQDILDSGSIMATGAGYNTVEQAKKEGLSDDMILQVPGPTEILAMVKVGRADAGALTFFEASSVAAGDDAVDVTDPRALPERMRNWVGIGFRFADEDFMAEFNKALGDYIGSDEMMRRVTPYGYAQSNLPGDKTAQWACDRTK